MQALTTIDEKLAQLRTQLRAHAPILIAYSGGVDSAYLLGEAVSVLGADQALGVIADSPSLPRRALAEALEVAQGIGARVEVVRTAEFSNEEYLANPPNRCYFCKAELFVTLEKLARDRGFRAIAYGENADDMRQERPGRVAAERFSILAPLRDAGLTKAEIRERSRELGLPTADAPAQPCLSSRIPWGLPVTLDALALVEKGEEILRSLGFQIFRVRHVSAPGQPPEARVEIAPPEMSHHAVLLDNVIAQLRAAGFAKVLIDPSGYRSPSV